MSESSCRYKWLVVFLLINSLLASCQPQASQTQVGPVLDPDWVSIQVSQEGVYRIDIENILRSGLDIDRFARDNVVLWCKGKVVPYQVIEDGKAISFYAPTPSSQYSAKDYYWLLRTQDLERIKASLHMPALADAETKDDIRLESTWDATTSGHVIRSIRFEENKLYTPQVVSGDRWLWEAYSAPKSQQVNIDLPFADGGPGRLALRIWARTEGPGAIDHHWEFWLNGQEIGDESWDGRGIYQFSLNILPNILRAGKNQFEIRILNDTGLKADIAYLDWFQFEYTSLPVVADDRLVFQALESTYQIEGFSGPVTAFQLDSRTGQSSLLGVLDDGAILATIPGERYWVAGPLSYSTPHSFKPGWVDPELLLNSEAATYLAIGPKDLLQPLEPLLEFHTSEGTVSRAINAETIYNQFNGGFPEPEAIQRYIQLVTTSWSVAPQYLLLVGDSSYDPHGYLAAPQYEYLPTYFVDTIFGGQTASDVPFSMLDGDELSDLAVGRVPAQTADQVQTFVSKTLRFTRHPVGNDRPSILAVADGQDLSFGADASRFLDLFPDLFSVRLLQPPAGSTSAVQEVIAGIRQSNWLVAYFGHGSINMWGRDHLLTTADVAQLDGASDTPLLINMTCLTGLFTHPEAGSLAEAMLFQESGGAVVVLAPTSLTLPGDQSFLTQSLAAELAGPGKVIIGDVLLQARRNIPLSSPGAQDVLLTFLLFGDPALQIR